MDTVKQVSISHKVPVFGGSAEMVATGGLYNFGTDYEELGRQAARMAIRISEGWETWESRSWNTWKN